MPHSTAYAIRATAENQWAIASEHPEFNRQEFLDWIAEHGEGGYFLRDPASVMDCHYFDEDVFLEFYKFEYKDPGELFRRVVKV